MQNLDAELAVFVVDDDAFQLTVFTTQLAMHGLRGVGTFLSGAEALSHISRRELDYPLIFLDLNMPEMDGVEFVRKLVEIGYVGALALVSGEDPRIVDSVARLATAHQLDVVGYLNKPADNGALASAIERWRGHITKRPNQPRKLYGADEIRHAIASGALLNHYQPKVHLNDGAFYGVEALVRWQHPQDGLVFPDQFIGPAEEHGLIEALTGRVLVTALEQWRRWAAGGLECSVAINLSMDNLVRLEFPDFIQSQLGRVGVPAEQLILEITESRLLQDMTLPLDVLTRLRLKRISLSIDDFGTGHSSLAQLRDLPFNEMKIDRSFVHGASAIRTHRAIVESNLGLAAQLGMTVVGEGIEDTADWKLLRDMKCTSGQGYLIARPMPGDDVPDWAKDWERRRPALCRL